MYNYLPNLLAVLVICPVAFVFLKLGFPIELIVFSVLFCGYKGPRWTQALRLKVQKSRRTDPKKEDDGGAEPDASSPLTSSPAASGEPTPVATASAAWRARAPLQRKGGASMPPAKEESSSWRASDKADGRGKEEVSSRRSSDKADARSKEAEASKSEPQVSPLARLKQNTSQTKWRSLINKVTPEKFEKLCGELILTLPVASPEVSDDDFRLVLEELLTLIFHASSRQHMFTNVYTDLCEQVLGHVSKQRPELDSRGCIWEKCQDIFHTTVLKPPVFPPDLDEEDLADRKTKHKHMMVGMVKFGGDLVGRGLLPPEGVIKWIHTLLSCEKVHDGQAPGGSKEKTADLRETQLEVLCAILASMGSSLEDKNTWNEENRLVIEDVLMQLEDLSRDTERLSLRIRCLIRDVLDLRMAKWKDKVYKLKPQALEKRTTNEDDSLERDKQWLDPQLIERLQAIVHHVEVIDDKESKLERLRKLIQIYVVIQDKGLVVVANSSNVKKVCGLITNNFQDLSFCQFDCNVSEDQKGKYLKGFETGATSVMVMSSELSTRSDFDFSRTGSVLVNFDFPMTLQLYLYRIFKRTEVSTLVYTFFTPQTDVRHAVSLKLALEAAKQEVPPSWAKLKDGAQSDKPFVAKGGGSSSKSKPSKPSESKQSKVGTDPADGQSGKSWRNENGESRGSAVDSRRSAEERRSTARGENGRGTVLSETPWRRDNHDVVRDNGLDRRVGSPNSFDGFDDTTPASSDQKEEDRCRVVPAESAPSSEQEPAERRKPARPEPSQSAGHGSKGRREQRPLTEQPLVATPKAGGVTIKQRSATANSK